MYCIHDIHAKYIHRATKVSKQKLTTMGPSQGIPRHWSVSNDSQRDPPKFQFKEDPICNSHDFSVQNFEYKPDEWYEIVKSFENTCPLDIFSQNNLLQVTTNHQEQSAPAPAPPERRRRAGQRVSVWCGKFSETFRNPSKLPSNSMKFHGSAFFFQASVPWWCNRNPRRILSIAIKHARYVTSKELDAANLRNILHHWLNKWLNEWLNGWMHAYWSPCTYCYIYIYIYT